MWPGGRTMPRSAIDNSGVVTQQNPSSYNQIPFSLVTYVSHVLISYFQATCPLPIYNPYLENQVSVQKFREHFNYLGS